MNRIKFNRAKTLASHIVLAMGLTALVACGGGGGGGSKSSSSSVSTASSMSSSSSSVAPDTTPEGFTFSAKTDVKRGDAITSEVVTIAGIDAAASVSITNGEYSIGGADTFVSTAGTITVGQTIKVRVTAPSGFDETQAAELNIGGVKATFSVTTEKQDTEPKAFTFNPVTDADFDSEHTSNELTIEEINDTTTIAIANGFYSVNGGAFTDVVGTVDLTDKVKVKGIAASITDTTKDVTLTIGGISGVFSITTFSDTTAPTAKIAFPPPVSKTLHSSIVVRGTVVDDYNDIESIKIYVNGNDSGAAISIDEASNPLTWRTEEGHDLVLGAGDNVIDIVAVDAVGNENIKAASVSVYKADDIESAFPDEDVDFPFTHDLVVYKSENSYFALSSSYEENSVLYQTNLSTGKRKVLPISLVPEGLENFASMVVDEDVGILYLTTINPAGGKQGFLAIDMSDWHVVGSKELPENAEVTVIGLAKYSSGLDSRFLFGSLSENVVGRIDTNLDSYEIFSTNTIPNSNDLYSDPWDLVFHPADEKIYVLNAGSPNFYSVDVDSGDRHLVSGQESINEDVESWSYSLSMSLDINDGHNRLLVVGQRMKTLLSVDVVDGARKLFGSAELMPFENPGSIATHVDLGFALVQDTNLNAVFAIDLESEQRVIVTKSN